MADWKSRRRGSRRGQHFKATEGRSHIQPIGKGTKTLGIPKRTANKKRVKGFSKLTRVQSKKQAVYGHSITHSKSYQKGVGKAQAKKEHDFLVKHYIEHHDSPLEVN